MDTLKATDLAHNLPEQNDHPNTRFKSLIFPNVCQMLSDLLLKWSKKDGFYIMGVNQTFNISSFGKRRTTIISGPYKTSLPDDRVFSIKFAITGAILFDFCFTNS